MTSSDDILLERDEDRLTIRFNRPEIRSPLSISVLEILQQTLDRATAQDDIQTIIFTGTGNAFASGANLNEIAQVTPETVREFAHRGQKLMNTIANAPQRTIASVNGFCFGGALDLALSCDTRTAMQNAVFCHPGVGLGIMTGWGGTQRLPRLIGEAKALEMFLTARQVTADEALQIGLIDAIETRVAEQPWPRIAY